MIAYRIADARHPVFDATGAMLHGGRWNSPGSRVIYAAETYAGALLEVLVHSNLSRPPKNHRVVRIEIPATLQVETVAQAGVPGWDAEDAVASRAFGDEWFRSRRTAVLRVPSVITQGREHNLVLNSDHPDFQLIHAGTPETVHWDSRLFPQLSHPREE
jgi:RES domain-containing protein